MVKLLLFLVFDAYKVIWNLAYHGDCVNPDVEGVAGTAQVRLIELVLLGPAQRGIAKALLDDGVEPGK